MLGAVPMIMKYISDWLLYPAAGRGYRFSCRCGCLAGDLQLVSVISLLIDGERRVDTLETGVGG